MVNASKVKWFGASFKGFRIADIVKGAMSAPPGAIESE